MFTLPKKLRIHLLNKFETVKYYFNDESYLINLLSKGIPTSHFLILQKLRRLNLDKIKDIDLVMLCGAFDFVLVPGCYPYTKEENIALNELGDAICDLKHYKIK